MEATRSRRRSTKAALALSLLTVAMIAGGTSPALADDYYCVVVYDSQGHPVNTTCVPWP
jgi:hypothetical protein